MPTSLLKPLSWFREDPTNLRKVTIDDVLRHLHDSLAKKQLVPLICHRDGTIIDGHRRFRAAMIDGNPPELEVVLVEDNVSPAEIKQIQLVTALHRADLTSFEVYRGLVEWRKYHPEATARDMAKAIDRSEGYVSQIMSLERLPQDVQEKAARGEITGKRWYELSKAPPASPTKPKERMARGKFVVEDGVTISVSARGGITLDDLQAKLGSLVKRIRSANDNGVSLKTLERTMAETAKKEATNA